jgi:nucleotide-binding universal stress UspA family protein
MIDPAKRRRFTHVVVGTDFTRHAHDAIARAMWLPIAPGGSVTLLHALPRNVPLDIETRLRAAATALMKGAQATAHAEAGRSGLRDVEVRTVVDVGRPADLVGAQAKADLVVVGRGQRRSLSERLLGSSAEQIVRGAPGTVLIVATAPDRPYRRPVVGIDLSDASKRALELTTGVIDASVETIEVVHAYDAPYLDMVSHERLSQDRIVPPLTPVEMESYFGEIEKSARSLLAQWIPGLGVTLNVHLHRGDPRRVLLEQANERRADLIADGHQDRSTLGRLLRGSVAAAVARAATCDVVVVR